MYGVVGSESLSLLRPVCIRYMPIVLGAVGQYRIGYLLGYTYNRCAFVPGYNLWHLATMSHVGDGYTWSYIIAGIVRVCCMITRMTVPLWLGGIGAIYPGVVGSVSILLFPIVLLCLYIVSTLIYLPCRCSVLYNMTKRLGYGVFTYVMLILFYGITMCIISFIYRPLHDNTDDTLV